MSTRARAGWRKRAKWTFCAGLVLAVGGACRSNAVDQDLAGGAGGKAAAGSRADGGKASALPSAGGVGSLPNAGRGGTRPHVIGGVGGVGEEEEEHPPHSDANAGYAGCSYEENVCGGCEAGHYVVKCSGGEISDPENDSDGQDWRSDCAAAQARAAAGAAGAAGDANASAGAAGASSYPGTCHSYEPRGHVVTKCEPGNCTETSTKKKRASA